MKEIPMAHPVVHAEIRSQDPDATRRFFADLFGWKIASEGAFPGYTFIDTGAQGGTFVAISPRQSTDATPPIAVVRRYALYSDTR